MKLAQDYRKQAKRGEISEFKHQRLYKEMLTQNRPGFGLLVAIRGGYCLLDAHDRLLGRRQTQRSNKRMHIVDIHGGSDGNTDGHSVLISGCVC